MSASGRGLDIKIIAHEVENISWHMTLAQLAFRTYDRHGLSLGYS